MKNIGLLVLVLFLSACSSVPPYQEFGFGGGYKDKEISSGIFELYYAGNAFASVDGVRQAWHKRATELCTPLPYKADFTFDGKQHYDMYTGVSFMPIGMSFPEVIGVVTCQSSESS